MSTNVLGPALVAQAFLPFVMRGGEGHRRVVLNMSSRQGSLGVLDEAWSKTACYSISEVGLNMLVSGLPSFVNSLRKVTYTYRTSQTRHQAHENPSVIFLAASPG